MSPLIVDVLILVTLLVLGVPIPFCFAGAVMYMGLSTGMDMGQMMGAGFNSLNSITLLAVAAFILAGGLMNVTGIADRLVDFAEALVGRVKGGLYGRQPSLENLDDGDLRFQLDYRSLYRTVVEDWWGVDFQAKESFPKVSFLKR